MSNLVRNGKTKIQKQMKVFGSSGGSASISLVFYVDNSNSKNFKQNYLSLSSKLHLIWPENVKISEENGVFGGSRGFVAIFSVFGVEETLNSENFF